MGNLTRATVALAALLIVGNAAGCSAKVGRPGTETSAPITAAPAVKPTAGAGASFALYDPTADARGDIDAALAAAKVDGKRVLIDFGADWCPDCHALAAYLEGTAGTALVDASFHVVKVDVGRFDHNLDISKQLGDPIANGIPAVVVLDGDGAIVGSTADGGLANARAMTEPDVLAVLRAWAP
jgi:thioredoxin 1